eukprot:15468356-Alexandrium_andersonii.AAC.1
MPAQRPAARQPEVGMRWQRDRAAASAPVRRQNARLRQDNVNAQHEAGRAAWPHEGAAAGNLAADRRRQEVEVH